MLLLSATLALSSALQSYSAVADYSSFLMANQFPGNGAIQVDRLYMAFGDPSAPYRIVVQEGEKELSSVDMVFAQEPQKVIGRLTPKPGWNGVAVLSKAGNFSISLQSGSEILTKMDFSVQEHQIGDQFTGKKIFSFNGPWRTHSAFVKNPNRSNLVFRVWLSMSEHFGEKTKKAEVVIKKAGTLVAKAKPFIVSSYAWIPFEFRFDKPDGRTAFMPADFEKLDGIYEAVLSLDGKVARTFKFTMKKGVMDTDPRSALNYSPRHLHILPRTVTSTTNDNTGVEIREVYWLPALK